MNLYEFSRKNRVRIQYKYCCEILDFFNRFPNIKRTFAAIFRLQSG